MNNLANVFAKLGRFPEAAALHHRAWTLRRQTLGLEHPDAQMSQRNLAVVLKILGKDGEAAEILSASTEKWGKYGKITTGNEASQVERWYQFGSFHVFGFGGISGCCRGCGNIWRGHLLTCIIPCSLP